MFLSDLSSQLIFALASVLIVSAILKLFTPNTWLLRGATAIEAIVGVLAVLSASSDGAVRKIAVAALIVLYSSYLFYTIKDRFQGTTSPCMCFGYISHKPARGFSIVRNVLLVLGSIAALFSIPASLSAVGVCLTVVMLGVILFEEIR